MTIKNPRYGMFADHNLCHTGMPAMSSVGSALQRTHNYLRNYAMNQHVACYIGRPDESVNGNLSAGAAGSESVGTFYIISGFTPRVDSSDRELLIYLKRWMNGYADGDETWEWYEDKDNVGADETLYDQAAVSNSVTDDGYSDFPQGQATHWRVAVTPVSASTDDGFVASKLTCTRVLPAILFVAASPDSSVLTPDQAIVPGANTVVGETLRGYDSGAGDSVGALVHYADNATDGAIQASRRCLFQTPYILGAYAENTTASSPMDSIRDDSNGTPITYKVKPRNLYDAGGASASDVDCDIAMVVTGDAGAKIRLTSATAADTWTYTVPGGGVTAELVTSSDGSGAGGGTGLFVDPDGDEIDVQTQTGAGNTVTIHTVSMWEPLS